MPDNPVAFLASLWESQPRPGYRFMAYFDDAHKFHEVCSDKKAGIDLPNDGVDVYFCPNFFSRKKRRNDAALPGKWLYADLDEATPYFRIPPTMAWETSPGRYQAAWELTRGLPPKSLAALNQRMTYATEADRGGWSLTKVLRVPGTISRKREEEFEVHLLWNDGESYDPRELWEILKHVKVSAATGTTTNGTPTLPEESAREIRQGYKLSNRAKKLLRTKTVLENEDRSARLWELYNLLLDVDMAPEEVLVVVRETGWNKWRNQKREVPQLWREICKAVESRGEAPKEKKKPKKKEKSSQALGKLGWMSSESAQTSRVLPPDWMVSGIWAENAHGLLAGEEKSYKSTLALDLAVSVATGTKFLGEFEVQKTGPVLFMQEENDANHIHWIHNLILRSRDIAMGGYVENGRLNLNLESPPIFFSHNKGFDLTESDHLDQLAADIELLKPKLLVLDPFYRMAPDVDENSASEVGSVLSPLLDLKQAYDVGVLLIHHYNKGSGEGSARRGSRRIAGSGVFGRWFESAVYVEKTAIAGTISLTTEHRKAPPAEPMLVSFAMEQPGTPGYNVDVELPRTESADEFADIRDLLLDSGSAGMFVTHLASHLDIGEKSLRARLARMPDIEHIKSDPRGRGRPRRAVRIRGLSN